MTEKLKFILAIFTFWFCSIPSFGQTNQTQEAHKIDSIVNGYLISNKIVGLSIGIVKNGQLFYSKGYGFTNVDSQYAVSDSTKFLMASIGKLFTATAIMQLVEDGKLDLNKRLIDYLPEFKMTDERYTQITLYQLMTHSSGLPWDVYMKNKSDVKNELRNYYTAFEKVKLKFDPGEKFSGATYSNAGFNLLGAVIEKVSGMPYQIYIQKNIFEKLNINAAAIFYKPVTKQKIAQGIEFNNGVLQYCPVCPIGTYDQLPSGYFYSSASDMQKFMLHCLNVFNGAQTKGLLTKKTLDEMWGQQKTIPNKKTSLGLCWWRYNDPTKNINFVFHVGDDPGNSSTLRIYPEQNIGIIILSNAYYSEHIVWNNLPDDIINLFKDEWKVK